MLGTRYYNYLIHGSKISVRAFNTNRSGEEAANPTFRTYRLVLAPFPSRPQAKMPSSWLEFEQVLGAKCFDITIDPSGRSRWCSNYAAVHAVDGISKERFRTDNQLVGEPNAYGVGGYIGYLNTSTSGDPRSMPQWLVIAYQKNGSNPVGFSTGVGFTIKIKFYCEAFALRNQWEQEIGAGTTSGIPQNVTGTTPGNISDTTGPIDPPPLPDPVNPDS